MSLEGETTKAEELLIAFAKKESTIQAVTKGNDPEEGEDTYYLLRPNHSHDSNFEDRVTELDLRIANTTSYRRGVMTWPADIQDLPENPYLGIPIYHRKS